MKSIILLISVSISLFSATTDLICAQNSQKMVVSHYMVGMSIYGNTVADLKNDINDAHNQGIEAFQLNMNTWNNADYKLVTSNMYQAASECSFPFYLFPSAGFGINPDVPVVQWSYDDIYNYLQLYGKHTNQLQVDGRPLFTSWLGEAKGVAFWKNVKKSLMDSCGINLYYVPWHASFLAYGSTIPLTPELIEKYLTEWNGVIDGFFWWGASRHPFPADIALNITPAKSIPTAAEYLSNALRLNNLSFMTPVVPSFWATCKDPCKYTEHNGAKGLQSQWMSIINNQTARWVNLVTWNDKGEDTHWTPHPNPSTALKIKIYSHAGYVELNKYYIQWWKTGQQPTIENDKIFYFYRTQFQDAVPLTENCPFNCNDTLPDKIYVTTMLVNPATLTIYSGSKTTVHQVPGGVYYWEAEMGYGSQRFRITRGAEVVIDTISEKLVDKIPQYKTRSLFSGFSETNRNVTSINKTISNNFVSSFGKTIVCSNKGLIQVYNFQGSKMLEVQVVDRLNTNMASGIYLVRFTDNNGNVSNSRVQIK